MALNMKLELMSGNLVQIIQQLVDNNEFAKLVHFPNEPLTQPNLPDNSVIFMQDVFPAPFDELSLVNDCVQVRVFYLDARLKKAVEETKVVFDIVCAKSLWLTHGSDGTTPIVRPYEILKEIVQTLDNVSVGTVGRLHFTNFRHLLVNDKFDAIRVFADMKSFNEGF